MKKAIFGNKTKLINLQTIALVLAVAFLFSLAPKSINADLDKSTKDQLLISDSNGVCKVNIPYKVVKKIKMVITAYSSTAEQTDDTPFITASGKHVTDGIIANNMLPFGTKVRIPSLFGDKVFTVEDRMNQSKGKYHADVWYSEYSDAKAFGAKITNLEVLSV